MKDQFFVQNHTSTCPACGHTLAERGTLLHCPGCERDFQREQDARSACELPFRWRALRAHYDALWPMRDSVNFCRALLGLPHVPSITAEEYAAARLVADGQPYPVPDHPYTVEHWRIDGPLSAIPGQEVTEEVYYDQFEVLPPFRLPRCPRTTGYGAGFQVSEAACDDVTSDRVLYSTYGRKNGKYYYLGLIPATNDPYRFL